MPRLPKYQIIHIAQILDTLISSNIRPFIEKALHLRQTNCNLSCLMIKITMHSVDELGNTMQESKVTSKGQTTLPRAVRSKLGLEAGDTVRYIVSGERVQILKARHASDLGGMLYRPGQRRVSLEEMDDAIAEGAAESAS